MKRGENLVGPDWYLLLTVLGLTAVGVLLVFDASYAKAADFKSMNHDIYYLVKRQAVFAVAGLLCMLVLSRFSFDWLRRFTLPLLGLGTLLLVAVLILGHSAHGAKSWFKLWGFFAQPSELAKLAVVLYLAGVLARPRTFAKGAQRRWVVPAIVCTGLVGMIVLQRDLGTGTLLAVVCFVMFFAAGAKKVYLALAGLVALTMVVGMMLVMPHCMARVRAFMDPWKYRYGEGYQTVHSLSGLGTGGLRGVGLCEGREKFYLPAASTDYIFSTFGEEAGLLGGLVLIGGFMFFTYRGLHIAHRSQSPYGALLAAGATSLVSIQAVINLAVVTSSIPATGLPLPFISYGGSSLVATLAAAGILLSASRQVNVTGEKGASEDSSDRRGNRRAHLPGSKRRASAAGYGPARRTPVHR